MALAARTKASAIVLAVILLGWMSIDFGNGGCDPDGSIELMVPAK